MTRSDRTIWLDLTRIVSRTGRGPLTGIDRVELAYLKGLPDQNVSLFGFARTATGFVLLDRDGMAALLDRIEGRIAWGSLDLQGRLSRRLTVSRQCAEADLRRLAIASCLRPGLSRLVRRHMAPGTVYLNVGHSNLDARVLGAIGKRGGRVVVMVHDAIPLDLPDDHSRETVENFSRRIEVVADCADLILCPSKSAAKAVRHHISSGPDIVSVPLGLTLAAPERLAKSPVLTRPYFVAVGTIDARKNQAFLLDVWEALGAHRPMLCLAGTRGWCPPEMAARFDDLPNKVVALPGLSDGAIATLISGSAGLLHPSKAEGYGFPLLEALLRDVPVVATDLPVYREHAGDIPVYLPPNDVYQWKEAVEALTATNREREQPSKERPDHPTWTAHLNLVLSHL